MNTTVAVMICGRYFAFNGRNDEASLKEEAQCRQ